MILLSGPRKIDPEIYFGFSCSVYGYQECGRYLSSTSYPSYAVFQRPLPQFHQLVDLTGAKHKHAVFQRPLPQGCRLS